MKVGLLTFHNALNYGSALQAYATQKKVNELGADCTIIDYINTHRKHTYDLNYKVKEHLRNKNLKEALKFLAGSFFIEKRRREFKKFRSEFFDITKETYRKKSDLENLNGRFDKFIVGSDQVWNFKHNGSDFAYFLNFVDDNSKKISYASSFGLSEVPNELEEEYAYYLNRIRSISTREQYGVKLIEQLTGQTAELVLDPVFLLSKSDWKSFYDNSGNEDKYIFCYTNKKSQLENFVSQTNYPLKSINVHKLTRHLGVTDFIKSNIIVTYAISLPQFIKEVANAELVVSASFHGVAMAIILQVPFVAILTDNKGRNERLINILKITGLENRILNEDMSLEVAKRPIDYEKVEGKLKQYREHSINFLRNAIFNP